MGRWTATTSSYRRRPTDRSAGIRIQKLLSRAGIASRRQAETLMADGRVRVNGQVMTTLGIRVDPDRDLVEVDGRAVRVGPQRWIVMNKLAGTLTTRRDPGGAPTVYDTLPAGYRGLVYVGRLDRDTEGLLLLTNDGDTANRLLHPSGAVEREYLADVKGVPDRRTLDRLVRGVTLDDGPARARRAEVTARAGRNARVQLVLVEGRKREVRRLLEAVGHPVTGLLRVRFGPLRLAGLAPGAWRALTRAEIRSLKDAPQGSPRHGAGKRNLNRRS